MTQRVLLLSIFLFYVPFLYGQEKKIRVSGKLELIRLSPETYMHISEGSNGMVTVNGGEAVIVSTPPSDEATLDLINWINDSLNAKITAVIIDSWHPDNMEGLDIFHTRHIKSYANEMTRIIAKQKSLPVPLTGFKEKMELKVGHKTVILRYVGPAHTSDGIVVWIPEEKILFGNNGVRNVNGWVGNIGDANLEEWPRTIEKLKAEFGSASYVIPGHGPFGGPELLDYTINLYKPCPWSEILKRNKIKPGPVFHDYGKVFITARADSASGPAHKVSDAVVLADKGDQYIIIESPTVKYNSENNSIRSDYGRIRIRNKDTSSSSPETDGYYKTLMVNFRNDAVGMTIILKDLIL